MELTPLHVDTERLHKLANAIMCQDEEDLQKTLDWPGPEKGSRQQLLNKLQVKTLHSGMDASSLNYDVSPQLMPVLVPMPHS